MKKVTRYLTAAAAFLPGTTLAHFQENHEPFWQEPLHYLGQHYLGAVMIGVVLVLWVSYMRKQSDREQ